MTDILPFPGGKARRKRKARSKTLCKSGVHKWEFDTERRFDVKQGKLVTLERCTRCGATRSSAR